MDTAYVTSYNLQYTESYPLEMRMISCAIKTEVEAECSSFCLDCDYGERVQKDRQRTG